MGVRGEKQILFSLVTEEEGKGEASAAQPTVTSWLTELATAAELEKQEIKPDRQVCTRR